MYKLNPKQFSSFKLNDAQDFVNYWSQFYNYSIKIMGTDSPIDYLHELNVGSAVTADNVERLLRWKDPKYLTKEIMSGPGKGQLNPRVQRVLSKLNAINDFRKGVLSEKEFRNITQQIFPSGIIWQIFLLHIAKPAEYPIFDQHVNRGMSLHKKIDEKINWKAYDLYRDYFSSIVRACNITVDEHHLSQLKQVDDALMAFGQFLKTYKQ